MNWHTTGEFAREFQNWYIEFLKEIAFLTEIASPYFPILFSKS